MKIALIGATGFVGSAILKEVVDRGHEVTAIVRHPEKVKSYPKLRSQKDDVYNEDEVARVVAGHDAVISAFNPGWGHPDIYNQQVKEWREESRSEAIAVRRRGRQFGSEAGGSIRGPA
ncbi:MAG TPA: NAD(P)H-binding protein [Nitrospiraceae bacterium]|nr:NAD(P)H-binding protein [Nitrospiraceae bacterium]